MNKHIVRIILGLGIIAIGIAALLGSLDIINFSDFFHNWWPLAVIAGGVLMFVANPRQFIWPLIIIVAGILLELRQLEIITFNIWQLFWPVVIIAVGLSILINRSAGHKGISKKDLDDITAIFSGQDTKNQSQDYKGGKITAVFGSTELDLRGADIKNGAEINVFALFGGVTIRVPENWIVKSTVTPIAGAVENKKAIKADGPTLIVSGDVMFGGVEIKH